MESPSRTQHNYLRKRDILHRPPALETFSCRRVPGPESPVMDTVTRRSLDGPKTQNTTLTVQTLSDAPASAVIHNERSWSDASFYETRQRKAVVHNDAPSIHTQVTAWQLHTASSLEPAWVGGVRASTGIEGVAREVRSCTRSNHDLLQNAHMWFNEAHGRRLRCRRNHNEHGF